MMEIKLFSFEQYDQKSDGDLLVSDSDETINFKYEKGEARIITEQGSFKLPLLPSIFKSGNYKLKPVYQRRITWDNKKRSKLIESFIMNVPVPPVFIYEHDYNNYEVMDGLQRISALIDFYEDKYALEGLSEWKELDGRKYSQLPSKVKEGIDRRQLQSVTLLKESTRDEISASKMKKMVFERLNTGGVQLKDQEIRNALYDGPFNQFCIKLSEYPVFRKLWNISDPIESIDDDDVDSLQEAMQLTQNRLYMRMFDVELVLRFFAMRHLQFYNGGLSNFLDNCLKRGNKLNRDQLSQLEKLFKDTVEKANTLFGDKAFCQYTSIRGKLSWSTPQKFIYDPLMIALSNFDLPAVDYNTDECVEKLGTFYDKNSDSFNGKVQSKTDILTRSKLFNDFVLSL